METTKTLVINSFNRTRGTSTSFSYEFPSSVQFSGIKLVEANIPSSYYNIVGTSLNFNDGLGTVVNLVSGNYQIAELCLEIQTQLQVFDINYTCVYNAITMRTTIANAFVAFDLPLAGEDNLARRLGYSATDFLATNSVVGSFVPQLIETEFYISSRNIGNLVNNGTFKSSFVITNKETRGDYSRYVSGDWSQIDYPQLREEVEFDFQLRDNTGSIVDLNGGDWTMIFRLNEDSIGRDNY